MAAGSSVSDTQNATNSLKSMNAFSLLLMACSATCPSSSEILCPAAVQSSCSSQLCSLPFTFEAYLEHQCVHSPANTMQKSSEPVCTYTIRKVQSCSLEALCADTVMYTCRKTQCMPECKVQHSSGMYSD